MRRTIPMVALAAALAAGACKKKKEAAAPPGTSAAPAGPAAPEGGWPDETPTREQVTEAWRAGGLKVGEFAPVDASAYGASVCEAGSVGGVDALICGYRDRREIRKAHRALLSWAEGARTVMIDMRRASQIALADRTGADPSGKVIQDAADRFRDVRVAR